MTSSNLYFAMVIAVFIGHAIYLNCVAEDAFITFRFAKNLAQGHGIVWNIGEPPVEGYTNFLWLVISAFILKLGLKIEITSQILGVLASIASLIYAYQFGNKLLNLNKQHALIPCLFLAVSGPFATWATSGMETNFFGLLLLMGCYHFTRFWKYDSCKDIFICFLALLLATLTRPEGFMIFCILLGLNLVLSIGIGKKSAKAFFLSTLSYIIFCSIYFILRFKYFGFLLPNTFYAKVGGSIYQYMRGAIYVGYFVLHFILPLSLLLVLVAWEKGISIRVGKFTFQSVIRHLENHLGMYVCVLICAFYTLYIVCVGGDYMAMYRFFVPFLPFIYILFGVAASELFKSLDVPGRRGVAWGVLAFVLMATLFPSTPLEEKLFTKPILQHGHYQGVQLERWHAARLALIGDFFNGYKHTSSESLTTGAIGAISYYADLKIYDLDGLVDIEIAHMPFKVTKENRWRLPGHQRTQSPSYGVKKKSTYIMYDDRRLTKERLEIKDPELYPGYKHTSVWLVDEKNRQEGYFTFLELIR